MPVTTAEMSVARSWIGTTETDDVFNERFDRLLLNPPVSTPTARCGWMGSTSLPIDQQRAQALNYAIEESLRSQLSTMTNDGPAAASAEGAGSYNQAPNISALRKMWEEFAALQGTRKAQVVNVVRRRGR